jgi:hypothetical protein
MVTRCLGGFRQMFSESLFEPMLTPLLDRLLLFLHDKSLNLRLKATSGIGLLFLSSPASVPKVRKICQSHRQTIFSLNFFLLIFLSIKGAYSTHSITL